MNRLLTLALIALTLLAPAHAQETPPDPITPRWTLGEWWEIAVDFESLEDGVQQIPLFRHDRLDALEGLALRGPRRGFSEVARWRLRVVRTKRFLDPARGEGASTPGWIVEARRIDKGERNPPTLTLVFVGQQKALSDVGIHTPGERVKWLNYDADGIATTPLLPCLNVFPIVWPDLRGGAKRTGKGHRDEKITQQRRESKTGVYFRLQAKDPNEGDEPTRIRWRKGEPWPKSARGTRGAGFEVRLLRCSRDLEPKSRDAKPKTEPARPR